MVEYRNRAKIIIMNYSFYQYCTNTLSKCINYIKLYCFDFSSSLLQHLSTPPTRFWIIFAKLKTNFSNHDETLHLSPAADINITCCS